MSITFPCPCGQELEVDEEYAGVDVSCPTCNGVVRAPARRVIAKSVAPRPPRRSRSGIEEEPPRRSSRPVYEVAEERPSRRRPVEDEAEERPSRRRPVEDDEDERPRRRRRRELDDEDDDRPSRRRRKRKESEGSQLLEARIFNGGTIGGAIAMLVAVVWFVAGLYLGCVFWYPPILFVIGLAGFIRGLVNQE